MRITSVAIWVLAVAIAGFAVGCGDDGGGAVDAKVADAPPIDSPPVQLTCASYCSSIMGNCTGATDKQFGSVADCMNTCTHFPVGTAADMAGNTLGCRIYHAGAAAGAPAVHCRHAGPGGNGACGGDCEGFCTLVLGSCTGANMQYGGNMGMCMTACNGFATTPPYDSSKTGGNSFACRLYHATVASGTPNVHCAHTGAVSTTCQ